MINSRKGKNSHISCSSRLNKANDMAIPQKKRKCVNISLWVRENKINKINGKGKKKISYMKKKQEIDLFLQ